MIQRHLAAIEQSIIELSKIQDNSGHSLHKGTPREIFVKNFLSSHLGSNVGFGTGEIIDIDSKPKEQRNQHDIIIYRNEFPKLDFQGGITAFLAESVIATIEVKSILDFKSFKKAFAASIKCKKLKRNFFEGLKLWDSPPAILNFIVAYNGPGQMKTIYGWIKRLESELSFAYPDLPSLHKERVHIASPGIDGVFILGKGFLHFDNLSISCILPATRSDNQWIKWVFLNTKSDNLLLLFLNLAQIICAFPQKAVQLVPYLKEFDGKLMWGG